MNPSDLSDRQRRRACPSVDALETRELLTGGTGNTFAIFPGVIAKASESAAVKFTIDPTHFTVPKGRMTIGVDIVKDPSANLDPEIKSIGKGTAKTGVKVSHAIYAANLPNNAVKGGQMTSAVVSTLKTANASVAAPATFSVNVNGLRGTTGKFLLGFYLPGDVNGDGTVDATDKKALVSALGSKAGETGYNFNADSNRDGRVTLADLQLLQRNMGVKTTVTPLISAELSPESDTGIKDRVTTNRVVQFTGNTTPGAAVKFQETGSKTAPVATTSDAKGNYTLNVSLGDGSNTFKVTTIDAFGQSISGNIAPVVYQTAPAVTPGTVTKR